MATIFMRRRPDSVMEWETDDVLDWLTELKLERFCKRFQSHQITGPILLQMDDLLLDDLQIESKAERHVMLGESRRLCLKELDLVDKALEYKQKTDIKSKSGRDQPRELQNSIVVRNDEDLKRNQAAACSGKADEVATRATLMVKILSQENNSLREQLRMSSKKDQCINMLQQEISKLKSENHNLRSKAQGLELENKRVLDELKQKCEKYKEIRDYEDIFYKLKEENMYLRDKFQVFKCKTIDREVIRCLSLGIKKDNEHSFHNPHAEECHSHHKQDENEAHFINEMYEANRRCAELEDTIRWLYAEILLAENGKKHLGYPNGNNEEVEEEDDEQAPSEPEWPSLIGKTASKKVNREKSDEAIVNRLMSQGLPTDTDEDIWKHQSIVNSYRSLKGIGSSGQLPYNAEWNV